MLLDYVISELEKLPVFDNRYKDLRCINIDRSGQVQRKGSFSVIFSAVDVLSNEEIILKFYDPDQYSNTYRANCFNREHEILKCLIRKKRCLQLRGGLKDYNLNLPITGTTNPTYLSLKYFATEYLPLKIEDHFYKDSSLELIKKLELFRQIILSVKALHDYDVFHRDLKPDNLRAYMDNLKRIVVAIDLGTAASSDISNMLTNYSSCAGHRYYSAPEAQVGLTGIRNLDFMTDFYALGCILYELFHYESFFCAMSSTQYYKVLSVCSTELSLCSDKSKKIQKWHELVEKYKNSFGNPSLGDHGLVIDKCIIDNLNELLFGLIAFDYRKRFSSFELILKKIDICMKILANEKMQKKILDQKRNQRQNRELKNQILRTKYLVTVTE